MKIKYKASMIMTFFGIIILLVISLVYEFQTRNVVIDRELNRLECISKEVSQNINSTLLNNIQIAQTISTAPFLRNALQESNTEFQMLSSQQKEEQIKNLNDKWVKTSDISDVFIQQHMTNKVADFFKEQQITLPGKYGEIFLTNRYGVMIATTAKLTTLAHANKYWWKAAYDDGKGKIFFDDRGYDASAKGYVIGIVIPIKENDEIIGILKCNINIIGSLAEIAQTYSNRNEGKMQIVRTGGLVICEKDIEPLTISIDDEITKHLKQEAYGSLILTKNSKKILTAFSPIDITKGSNNVAFGGSYKSIDHINGNKGEGWHVILSLDREIALITAHKTTQLIIFTGIIMTIIASFLTLILSTFAVKNIVNVSLTAKELGKGHLDVRSKISSHDEIDTLSHNLNDMADNLQESMAKRDELISEMHKRKIVEEKLFIMSTTDELTGAYNRRAFNDNLKLNILHAKEQKQALSMLMLDIDDFKKLNDTYGHDVGDLILISIVSIIAKSMRKEDTVARWGGDEFTIMLPKTGKKEAKLLAKRLNENVAKFSFPNNIKVTLSIGVTELIDKDYSNLFLKRADEALYKAKESGKNRVFPI